MSARMCSSEHLCALAAYAVHFKLWLPEQRLDRTDACQLAELLYAENVKSYSARSPNGPEPAPFQFINVMIDAIHAPTIAIIKSAKCYMFQCCEHEGWESSIAKQVMDAIIDYAIYRLPGYDDANWGSPIRKGGGL